MTYVFFLAKGPKNYFYTNIEKMFYTNLISLTHRCYLWCSSVLQTRPRCAPRPASCQGGACHLGATLSHSESTVHRVHEALSGSREQRLAWSKSTQSLLCLLQGKTVLLAVGYYPPSPPPAYIRVSFLINVKRWLFLLIKIPLPSCPF